MNLASDGEQAIVTDGTGGIGYALAEVLTREGASVVLSGRTVESLEKAVRLIKAAISSSYVRGVVADLESWRLPRRRSIKWRAPISL